MPRALDEVVTEYLDALTETYIRLKNEEHARASKKLAVKTNEAKITSEMCGSKGLVKMYDLFESDQPIELNRAESMKNELLCDKDPVIEIQPENKSDDKENMPFVCGVGEVTSDIRRSGVVGNAHKGLNQVSSINDVFQAFKKFCANRFVASPKQKVKNVQSTSCGKGVNTVFEFQKPYVQGKDKSPISKSTPPERTKFVDPRLATPMKNDTLGLRNPYKLVLEKQIGMLHNQNGVQDPHLVNPVTIVPRTRIPQVRSIDNVITEHFESPNWTRDPRINFLIKTQNHTEISNYFKDYRNVDVENMFPDIYGISNMSPNRWHP